MAAIRKPRVGRGRLVAVALVGVLAAITLAGGYGFMGQTTGVQSYVVGYGGGSVGGGGSSQAAAASTLSVRLGAKVDVGQRCALTRGRWCADFHTQPPVPSRSPPSGSKACLWGCNNVGVCDGMAGWCRCPAGWQGDACDERMRRPCSQHLRSERQPEPFEPFDQPNDYSVSGLKSRCAGYCDQDIGICFCNATFAHGRVPPPPGSSPGTPPLRFGRQMGMHCQPNQNPHTGEEAKFGDVSLEDLFGSEGWCQADAPKLKCPCQLDGWSGPYCENATEYFCINQCNGHGDCYLGFCKCHAGWFGHDCAYREEGVAVSPGLEAVRPWLADTISTPAAADPPKGATRLRPLIYIYELPPKFNQHILQYRVMRDSCTHRLFGGSNETGRPQGWDYGSETALHEYLAQSPHRTLDPEEADYFFMPLYLACFLYPVHGWNDFPWFHGGPNGGFRAQATTNMMLEAWSWVQSHHPYWDRRGGRDHIIVAAHDEGSCFVPAVLRPAILLTHYGNTRNNPSSDTHYWQDKNDVDYVHHLWQPEGHLSKIGTHPCYNASKDLTIPLVWPPEKYNSALVFGGRSRERHIFALFKGRIAEWDLKYSRGVRQRLANLTAERGWWEEHRIWVSKDTPPGVEGTTYSDVMASAVFCFVLMGDGWSARFDEAIIHGCIPVTIMEDVHHSFETIMDVSRFSVRIDPKDLERVPEILKAISKEKIEEMQSNIAKVWRRFFYTGLKSTAKAVQGYLKENAAKAAAAAEARYLPAPETDYDPEEDDAFATIIQWLHSRIPHTR